MKDMLTYTKAVRKLIRTELFDKNVYGFIATNNYPKSRTVKVYTGDLKDPKVAVVAIRNLMTNAGFADGSDFSIKYSLKCPTSRWEPYGAFIVRFAK